MTIASEITRINNNIASAYTAVNNKGGTLPATQNSANLATAIGSIPSGSTPTLITKTITQNGTYNASSDNADGYSSVTVNVSGGGSSSAPIFDGNYFVDSNGSITNFITFKDQSSISHNFILKPFAKSFTNSSTVHNWLNESLNEVNNSITGIREISKIGKLVSSQAAFSFLEFESDRTTQYISFRALEEAIFTDGKQFRYLTSLKKVDLHNAKKIALPMSFVGLSSFEEIDLSSAEDLTTTRALGGTSSTGGAFANTSISELSLPALKSTSFGSYTNQFDYMLKGVTGCTVHFPSNLQSVIGSWSSVTSGFGGTNTIVLFDLPTTS